MTIRQQVYNKYNGLCAYTGKPLGDDWEMDHITPKCHTSVWHNKGGMNSIENLIPSTKIVNHYKRSLNLEQFIEYMSNFHKRLAKLPKKTLVDKTKNRIRYMNEIADLFGITPDSPFSGKFYYETHEPNKLNNSNDARCKRIKNGNPEWTVQIQRWPDLE